MSSQEEHLEHAADPAPEASQDVQGRIMLTYMNGPNDGKTLTWDLLVNQKELEITIGRREGCDVVLGYDSQVSRLHARVIYNVITRLFFLEDAGSRNGTFLGETRLRERAPLPSGALFRVGRTWLKVDPLRAMLENVDLNDVPF